MTEEPLDKVLDILRIQKNRRTRKNKTQRHREIIHIWHRPTAHGPKIHK